MSKRQKQKLKKRDDWSSGSRLHAKRFGRTGIEG